MNKSDLEYPKMSIQNNLQDSIGGVEAILKQVGVLEDGHLGFSPFLKQSISESNISEKN